MPTIEHGEVTREETAANCRFTAAFGDLERARSRVTPLSDETAHQPA